MILSRRPGPPLQSVVECIWHHESQDAGTYGRERVLPDGCFQMVLDLAAGAAAVSGLRSGHVVVDTATTSWVMGVVFRPGAARLFFEGSALEFSDCSVPLASLWGPRTSQLIDRLQNAAAGPRRLDILEAALVDISIERDTRHMTSHPLVTYALRTFQSAPCIKSVRDVSREIGWSRRWLTQTFGEAVGMTPKRYCRLLRFQEVVRQVASGRRVEWASLAIASGYTDQAHLVHEFRAFSGLSPERFLRAERPFRNHVRLD